MFNVSNIINKKRIQMVFPPRYSAHQTLWHRQVCHRSAWYGEGGGPESWNCWNYRCRTIHGWLDKIKFRTIRSWTFYKKSEESGIEYFVQLRLMNIRQNSKCTRNIRHHILQLLPVSIEFCLLLYSYKHWQLRDLSILSNEYLTIKNYLDNLYKELKIGHDKVSKNIEHFVNWILDSVQC